MNENKRIKRLTDQNTRLLGEVAELKEKLAAEKAKQESAEQLTADLEEIRKEMLDTIAEAKESRDKYDEALRDIRLLRKQMKSSYDKMVDDLLKGNKVSLIDRLKQKWG